MDTNILQWCRIDGAVVVQIQMRTHPRATQQGRVKLGIPVVLTQEAIPEEGG